MVAQHAVVALVANSLPQQFPFIRQKSSSNLNEYVYRGLTTGKKRSLCSVKKMDRAKCKDDIDEMKILKSLTHDNILKMFDVHIDMENCFVATEVKHGDLEMLVASKRIDDNKSKVSERENKAAQAPLVPKNNAMQL